MDTNVWQPYILSASMEPQPAMVGQTVKLTVKVLDVFGGEQIEAWYSGDLQSGEV